MARGSLLRFGIFAALSLALTGFILVRIAEPSLSPQATYVATFDTVNGLQPGDDVRLAGVRIGHVRDVSVVEGRARVSFEVDGELDLPTDTVVTIQWVNLIGVNELKLLPGEKTTTMEPGGEFERTRPGTDLAATVAALGPLTRTLDPDRINTLTQAVHTMLEGREADIARLVSDLETALSTFTERRGTVEQLLRDYATISATIAEREDQIRMLVDDLTVLAETFDASDAVLAAAISDTDEMLQGVDAFLARSADELETILDDLVLVNEALVGELDTVEQVLVDMPDALANAIRAGSRGDAITLDVCTGPLPPPCSEVHVSGDSSARSVLDLDTAALRRLLLGGAG